MFAYADDQDLGPNGPEVMQLFQVVLQLVDQLVLDMEHSFADLAERVLVLLAGELVVHGAAAQADRMHRARGGEGFESAVDRAPRQRRIDGLDVRGYLVRCAVPPEGVDGVPDELPLPRLPESRGQGWPGRGR